MKISTRISLTFSVVSSLVLVAFGVSVYFITKNHTEYDFVERLKKRVEITENFFLEKETFSAKEFEQIKTQFSHTLNEESEEIIELIEGENRVFIYPYPKNIKRKLQNNDFVVFRYENRQGVSKVFEIDGKKYLIIVTAFNEIGQENLSFLLTRIFILVALGVVILLVLSILIAKKTLHPISEKIEHANRISATNLHERLNVVNPKDELGKMATAFNNLLDRLEKSFEAQKSFISDASHEIRNPLTAILGEAEIASSKERSVKEYMDSFSVILSESERLNLTVNNLLQLSKVSANTSDVSLVKLELSSFVKELIENYGFVNPENNIVFNSLNIDFYILGNSSLLKSAVINLIDNACKFSSNNKVLVSIIKKGNNCVLVISDKGIGIPQMDLDKITNPFFRGGNTISIKGSGIGLSLSKRIVELHNGELKIQSKEREGTEVFIIFPIA